VVVDHGRRPAAVPLARGRLGERATGASTVLRFLPDLLCPPPGDRRKTRSRVAVLHEGPARRWLRPELEWRKSLELIAEGHHHEGGDARGTAAILTCHSLPEDEGGLLWEDRFQDFLQWRQDRLGEELAIVTEPPH
jgi:hypothetical protein